MQPPADPRPAPRGMNGLVLLFLLVFLGLGVTSAYYKWKAPRLIAERKALIESAPKEPEPRLEHWLLVNGALVHHRLQDLRISPRAPWLVTHALPSSDASEPPELWGVDLTGLAMQWIQREGMRIVVDLPAARSLGRAWLPEDKEQRVPKVPAGEPAPTEAQSAERARSICEYALEPLIKALPMDIPGAALVVRVGGAEPPQSEAR